MYLKADTNIDPITVWFKIMEYNDRIVISIVDLVENTWLTSYLCPIEIMHDQGP